MRHSLSDWAIVLIAIVVTACTPGSGADRAAPESARSDTAWDAARVDTLIRLGRADQKDREDFARAVTTQDTASIFAGMRADSARTRWVRAAIARHGWPIAS